MLTRLEIRKSLGLGEAFNPTFESVAAHPPPVQASTDERVNVVYADLSGGWIARWHNDTAGRPVLRALFRLDAV